MRVVVIDHDDSYTYNLVDLVASVSGRRPDVVAHDRTSLAELAGYTHLVLSPGPGHPEVAADFALGAGVFGLKRPLFGVCLGLQALVVAFGGVVEPIAPAHGRVSVVTHDGRGVFTGVPDHFEAVRYHSLAATSVPADLVVTARAEDGVVMGVRHPTLPLEAVQFHPESILSRHGAELVGNFLRGPRAPVSAGPP